MRTLVVGGYFPKRVLQIQIEAMIGKKDLRTYGIVSKALNMLTFKFRSLYIKRRH